MDKSLVERLEDLEKEVFEIKANFARIKESYWILPVPEPGVKYYRGVDGVATGGDKISSVPYVKCSNCGYIYLKTITEDNNCVRCGYDLGAKKTRRITFYSQDGNMIYSDEFPSSSNLLHRAAAALKGGIKNVSRYEIQGKNGDKIIVNSETDKSDIDFMNKILEMTWNHHDMDSVIKSRNK